MKTFVSSKSKKFASVDLSIIKKQSNTKINKCLEYWMYCILDSIQEEGVCTHQSSDKTGEGLKRIRNTSPINKQESFRRGYINAANEVSRTLAFVPKVDIEIGKKLLTHLGHNLNQVIERSTRGQCSSPSPVSSGYESDDSDSLWRQCN
ncbi:HES6.2 family protein [Megaselia abdita]